MQFMAMIVFKASSDLAAILPHLPAEQARVAALARAGVIEKAFMTPDRRRGWMVLAASDLDEARRAVDSLPLRPFMDLEIVALGAFDLPERDGDTAR